MRRRSCAIATPIAADRGPVVCDASVVVALLLDSGPDGEFAAAALSGRRLVAPAHMPFEAANVIRRTVLRGGVDRSAGAQAHADLTSLAIELWTHDLVAERLWELVADLTAYDAAYVAVAEALGIELVTLDRPLSRATGPRCRFVVPA